MSVAAVQQQLQASRHGEPIELGRYLSLLCETLAASMIGNSRPISITAHVQGGKALSTEAVSIGLIVTELVINALKHGYRDDKVGGEIIVAYDAANTSWRLTVCDNGIGRPEGSPDETVPGLGTSIVEALAKQLDARVDVARDPHGTMVSITHAACASRLLAVA